MYLPGDNVNMQVINRRGRNILMFTMPKFQRVVCSGRRPAEKNVSEEQDQYYLSHIVPAVQLLSAAAFQAMLQL